MSLHLGDAAPDFTVATTQGEISLTNGPATPGYSFSAWVFFFSHPGRLYPGVQPLPDARFRSSFEETRSQAPACRGRGSAKVGPRR